MFWRRKKDREPCNHYWHKLSEEVEWYEDGYYDANYRDVTWIMCEKCECETKVTPEKWERIKKKQEILAYKH